MVIDRKYQILAVNPCNGHIHTEADSILFNADDRAVPAMLRAYKRECERIGCEEPHIESISLLHDRVLIRQSKTGGKVPDTDTQCEIDRCIGGKV